MELATRKQINSIDAARIQLEQEGKNIETLLGGMDKNTDIGPECPKLPPQKNSMDIKNFTLTALKQIGAILTPQSEDTYLSEIE